MVGGAYGWESVGGKEEEGERGEQMKQSKSLGKIVRTFKTHILSRFDRDHSMSKLSANKVLESSTND